MNTDELIKSAMDLTMMHGLSEGPRNTSDQLGIALVNALIVIALELKRANDFRAGFDAMPVPASDEDYTGVADWRTKCKNCGEPLGDSLECDSCGYDNIPF